MHHHVITMTPKANSNHVPKSNSIRDQFTYKPKAPQYPRYTYKHFPNHLPTSSPNQLPYVRRQNQAPHLPTYLI